MRRLAGRFRSPMLAAALMVAAFACRSPDAPVQELFALRSQGLVHLQRGELPEAEDQFSRLVELAPDDPFGHANLGLTYLRAGRLDEAERPLRRALRLAPNDVEVTLMVAKLYSLTDQPEEARELLEAMLTASGNDPRIPYALAEIDALAPDAVALRRREARLRETLSLAPANLAVRLQLANLLMRRGEADSVIAHLEEVRRIPPALPGDGLPLLDSAIGLLHTGELGEASPALARFHEAMQLTVPYQAALYEVGWVEGPLAGHPVLTFAPEDVATLRALRGDGQEDFVTFVDVTAEAGLPESAAPAAMAQLAGSGAPPALAIGDIDADGAEDLFVAPPARGPSAPAAGGAGEAGPPARLYRLVRGQALEVTTRSGISLPAGARDAIFADYDNDGWLDLFVIGGEGRGHLFRNRGDVTFEEVSATAGIAEVGDARRARFVDLDHDGDLDLLLVGEGGARVYRNNLNGTFSDATAELGLAGIGASDARFGDLDGDGRIDLLLSGNTGVSLQVNQGARRFADSTAAVGLAVDGDGGAPAIVDLNNDGRLDIFIGSGADGQAEVWLGADGGGFTRDRRSDATIGSLQSGSSHAIELLDYDNDGWVDLLVAAGPGPADGGGVRLLRNSGDGTFADRSALLTAEARAGSAFAVADVDDDGDLDIVVADANGSVRVLRNDGGNLNRAMRVRLKALRTGSGKNNDFGIGSRVEVRAGETHQTRVATSPVTHVGLGPRLKADVVRIEWPNGVPQLLYLPGSDEDVLEAEKLKGSCAFLYTWDGEGFRFVTDVMWRSALGMPLGLMGRGTAFAPAAPSREYLRIPGDALVPRDGRYVMQLTEELWETAYVDEVRLVALDHPDSVDVFVDERFVPPGPVEMRIYPTVRPRAPLRAYDERGTDLLPALRASDDHYVSNLTPLRYQGLVEPHDLVLELDAEAGAPGTFLFLRGWIYPTDASINVALSQQTELAPSAPSLEVRDASGGWRTVVPDLGFPSGKDKTMVIDLAGIFPTADRTLRIRTNLQIYWDQAFVATEVGAENVRVTTLAPLSSELRYRGFSRTFRKGGRYGPHWFAYDDVTRESPWRPIEGAFTRFGDVLPLLREPDDMYVIMGPGDETTVQFDAASADGLPAGWSRDFLLYTDGWIKDADHNTAYGNTVEPLPFQAISQYPYGPGEGYPDDAVRERYRREYNTRVVGRR